MEMKLDEKDREKILAEIADCQNRILQTLVPTILAVGLVSIADKKHFALITLFASFAILFGASLYIANLSYKIFRNATFIKAITERENNGNDSMIHWEKALSIFSKKAAPPAIIGYETKTIAVIFLVFALVYTLMFFSMQPVLSIVFGAILGVVAASILMIPSKSEEYYMMWKRVLEEYVN